MKTTIKVKQEVEIKTIQIDLAPRYVGDGDDDDVPNDFPLLSANKKEWSVFVDVDTGKIKNWPQGEVRDFWSKVCDEGVYTLFDEEGNDIATISGYVPNGIVPGEYGDYVDLKINADGVITNWPKSPDLSAFFKNDD